MNEAGNIHPLINEIAAIFAGRHFEIIYIDDASTDSTADELAVAQSAVPQLRVLRHFNRAGQSAAIRSGLLRARGVLIGVLDGDGQNVPAISQRWKRQSLKLVSKVSWRWQPVFANNATTVL